MNGGYLRRESRRLARLARLIAHLAVGAVIARVVFAGLARLPRQPALRARNGLVRWWSSQLCRIVNLQVRIEGSMPSRPTLVVANHVSWLDIPCLLSTVDAAFVSKRDVLRWPVVGAMAARSDTIFLERGGRNAATRTADQMTWRLASRRNVIFFPEGTTTDGTTVRPFHARLFQAAIRTHSAVQAIALRYGDGEAPDRNAPFIGNDELVPHLWKLLGEEKLVVRLRFSEPVMPSADRRSTANYAHRQVCAALGLEAPQAVVRIRRQGQR